MNLSWKLRGVTLTHPWAFAVTWLGKDIENRSWHPSRAGLRPGDVLAIHGGAPPTGYKLDEAIDDRRHVTYLTGLTGNGPGKDAAERAWRATLSPAQDAFLRTWQAGGVTEASFITPGIVALALLGHTAGTEGALDGQLWAAGDQFNWPLVMTLPLPEAVPHRGAQRAWKPHDDQAKVLTRHLEALTPHLTHLGRTRPDLLPHLAPDHPWATHLNP